MIDTNPIEYENDEARTKAFPNMDCFTWDNSLKQMVDIHPPVEIPDEFHASTGDAPEDLDLRYADVGTFVHEIRYTLCKLEGAGYHMYSYLIDHASDEFFVAVAKGLLEEDLLGDVAESALAYPEWVKRAHNLCPEVIPSRENFYFWLEGKGEDSPISMKYYDEKIAPILQGSQ